MSTPGVRNLAWRFVAGESLDAGIEVARSLRARGIDTTLNFVGTHVRDRAATAGAAAEAIASLRHMREAGLTPNVSVKLTHIGLDIDEAWCRTQLAAILEAAREVGGFVRIDMEESPYTARTVELFEEVRATHGDGVGIVLQSYLHRNHADVRRLGELGARIRICKGGYWESSAAAWHARGDVDRAFREDVEFLLRHGSHPAIASHDRGAVAEARRVAREAGLGPEAFEFQMLYGVATDLQEELVRDGHRVRCYVPYGSRWYEYVLGCIRRLPGALTRRLSDRLHDGLPS